MTGIMLKENSVPDAVVTGADMGIATGKAAAGWDISPTGKETGTPPIKDGAGKRPAAPRPPPVVSAGMAPSP
jgi:hypothetical protein